ncbi:MAG: hypothetical protein L0H93_01965 [Nocardioides sp.]|nr:hypothetical protein [Nocardioides sp.]
MSVRVYLPVTRDELARLVEERRLPGPREGHAVTDMLRAEWPDGDDEGWEYAAMQAAAADSWHLRVEGDVPRRFVVAADVSSVAAGQADDVTAVQVEFDVVWKNVAAAHADTDDLDGDPTALDAPDIELAWYATQELADLTG